MEPMTVSEHFEDLSIRFDTAGASGLTKTMQWNITGAQGGVWAFEIVDGVGRLIPGGVEEPDTILTTSDETWIAVAEGKQDPMKAFMMGKVKVTGDMTFALQTIQLFGLSSPTP